jgi:hypothetical protein
VCGARAASLLLRRPVNRFRWRCGHRHGQWHPTRREAQDAAVKAKLAIWDEHVKDRWLPGAMVGVEEE